MKQLSNPLDANSLLNKEIGETTMSKTKYKYTVREVLVKYFSNEGWTKSGHELLKLNLQETKEVKLKPKYISPEIEEMKRLSDEFFSKYLGEKK